MLKKLRSQIGEGEATQRSAMAETTNTFEGQREVAVLLDPRAGILQQKLKSLRGLHDWSWSYRGDSATVKDALQSEKDGENHPSFSILPTL